MSSSQTGKSRQKAGRKQKPLPDDGMPRTILAAQLRELKKACGDPPYEKLAALSGVYKTGLIEAASATRLPPLYVIVGYVKGCWAYHEEKLHGPFAEAGDLSRWQQLYDDADRAAPGECPPERAGEHDEQPESRLAPLASDTPPVKSAAGNMEVSAPEKASRFTRGRATRTSGGRGSRVLVVAAIAAVILLIAAAGVRFYPHPKAAAPVPGNQSVPGNQPVQGSQGGSISVAAPTPACGRAAQDGFRSPARTPFANVRPLRTVSLEGLSASVEQGTYRGGAYVWLESSPTGNRAGIQLRWSNAPKKWYYCTATVESGDVSALPGEFATVAIPATVGGHHVIYQACMWHQRPFTSQCSSPF